MRKMNVHKLINTLLEVKEKADLDYVYIDEDKGNDLVTIIDRLSYKLGDFCNGIVILSRFHDDMYNLKIYTQLELYQQKIMLDILRPHYSCEIRAVDDVLLHVDIIEKGENISFMDMYKEVQGKK